MFANLFLIFFIVNLIKKTIDDFFKKPKQRYQYGGTFIYPNELAFSFITNIGLIVCYLLSLLSGAPDIIFITFGFNVVILVTKLNQFKRTIGTKIMYCLYLICLLIPLQNNSSGSGPGSLNTRNPMIGYTMVGALITLIPEPVRNIRIALSTLDKERNNRIWLTVAELINFISFSVDFVFKSILNPVFCFMYVRSVPDVRLASLVFLINMVGGTMMLLDKVAKDPGTLTKLKSYIPVY